MITYKFNPRELKKDVEEYVVNELPALIDLLKKMAAGKGIKLPKKEIENIKKFLGKSVIERASQRRYSSRDLEYLYGLPPFIEGHLKARQLL